MMPPVEILANLCGECIWQNRCETPDIIKFEGGVSCASHVPNLSKEKPIKPEHIDELPQRTPCSECACRKGTQANSTPHTVNIFNACVSKRVPFLCHGKEGNGRLCGGWLSKVKSA